MYNGFKYKYDYSSNAAVTWSFKLVTVNSVCKENSECLSEKKLLCKEGVERSFICLVIISIIQYN